MMQYTARQQRKLDDLESQETPAEEYHGGPAAAYQRACRHAWRMYKTIQGNPSPKCVAEQTRALGWPFHPPEGRGKAEEAHAVLRKKEGEKNTALDALEEFVELVEELHP
ncbi:hypothetical protein CMO91_03435 [Candidatus Woesearchaeota archaeon]|nr:hypothetical protein [Candidatus Woesearchaeota archaeon]|tara:strand:- start:103 stop:432 length:330 start_codon:yes stop_codon:yes gene_type:complete